MTHARSIRVDRTMVMLSNAKHLVFKDSSIAVGDLGMTWSAFDVPILLCDPAIFGKKPA